MPGMGVFADNIVGSCHDGTIHKFVVVRDHAVCARCA